MWGRRVVKRQTTMSVLILTIRRSTSMMRLCLPRRWVLCLLVVGLYFQSSERSIMLLCCYRFACNICCSGEVPLLGLCCISDQAWFSGTCTKHSFNEGNPPR